MAIKQPFWTCYKITDTDILNCHSESLELQMFKSPYKMLDFLKENPDYIQANRLIVNQNYEE